MDRPLRTIDLLNRVLAYREYGAPDGIPVFYMHSYPSSSVEAAYIDDAAAQRNLRLVAIDRPGMGGSSMSPNRSLLEITGDVAHLADHLEIEKFAMLGLSAGAPYVWACGSAYSHRLTALGVVSGVVPDTSHTIATIKAFAALAILPIVGSPLRDPETAERSWMSRFRNASEVERAAARDPRFRAVMLRAAEDAFLEGSGGPAKDTALVYGAHWGFAMGNITVADCFVWQGEQDRQVSLPRMHSLVDRLPSPKLTLYPHDGHLSTWVNHHDEILDTFAHSLQG